MENDKRVYSLNLGAYIITITNLMPEIREDENTSSYYLVFPECAGVKEAIKEYKKGNPVVRLHDFLHSMKQIRASFAALKQE